LNEILADAGHAPFVIQPFYKVNNKPSNVIMLPYIPKINNYINHLKSSNFFLSFSKKIKPFDVVICHYPIHYNAIKKNAKNLIVLSHGTDWHEAALSRTDKIRKKAAMDIKAMKNKPVLVANDSHFLNKLGIKALPAQNYFSEIEKDVWFIPNCVDSNYFCPTNTERKKQVLIPRNVREDRGIHLAIKGFSEFNVETPGYELVIAGFYNDSDPYYIECIELIKSLDLTDYVRFTGSVQRNEMKRLYQESTMSVIPTIELEGTSLSALESMACQTPTISTIAGGLVDLPTLKCDFSPSDLGAKMNQVVNEWNELSLKQNLITIETFSIANWQKAWLNVIDDTIKRNK
jgi:glycosyltransferase involved in cell wall biosynthesis